MISLTMRKCCCNRHRTSSSCNALSSSPGHYHNQHQPSCRSRKLCRGMGIVRLSCRHRRTSVVGAHPCGEAVRQTVALLEFDAPRQVMMQRQARAMSFHLGVCARGPMVGICKATPVRRNVCKLLTFFVKHILPEHRYTSLAIKRQLHHPSTPGRTKRVLGESHHQSMPATQQWSLGGKPSWIRLCRASGRTAQRRISFSPGPCAAVSSSQTTPYGSKPYDSLLTDSR